MAGLSAVMHGAAVGEHIARAAASANGQERTGAEPYEGRLGFLRGLPCRGVRLGERRLRLRDAAGAGREAGLRVKRVGGAWAKSQARRWLRSPGRAKPKGAASGRRLQTVRSPGTLERVKTQEPRPVGPAHRFGGGNTGGRNGMWVHLSRKRGGYLSRGESSEG